jgi:hypothetical protein
MKLTPEVVIPVLEKVSQDFPIERGSFIDFDADGKPCTVCAITALLIDKRGIKKDEVEPDCFKGEGFSGAARKEFEITDEYFWGFADGFDMVGKNRNPGKEGDDGYRDGLRVREAVMVNANIRKGPRLSGVS